MHVYTIIWCFTQLMGAYSGSGSSCRNLERVVLVSELTVYRPNNLCYVARHFLFFFLCDCHQGWGGWGVELTGEGVIEPNTFCKANFGIYVFTHRVGIFLVLKFSQFQNVEVLTMLTDRWIGVNVRVLNKSQPNPETVKPGLRGRQASWNHHFLVGLGLNLNEISNALPHVPPSPFLLQTCSRGGCR